MTAPLVTDHAWRYFPESLRPLSVPEGACAYLNCRRPREDHVRVAVRGDLVLEGLWSAREAARS